MNPSAVGGWIQSHKEDLAKKILDRQLLDYMIEDRDRINEKRDKCLEDIGYHLSYLANALDKDSLLLFEHYVIWVRKLFQNLGISISSLADNLKATGRVLREALGDEAFQRIRLFLDRGSAVMSGEVSEHAVEEEELDSLWNSDVDLYIRFLLEPNRAAATKLVMDRLDQGVDVKMLYLHIFQPALRKIGRMWQTNTLSVAQEHYFTASTQWIMSLLYHRIFETPHNGFRLVGTCVGGELHEIGMRMVCDFFEMEGWDTYYLGANTPTQAVLEAVDSHKPHLVAISTTMVFHIPGVEAMVRAVKAQSGNPQPWILLGGYPFNRDPELWKKVGGDAFGQDAQMGVMKARHLIASGKT